MEQKLIGKSFKTHQMLKKNNEGKYEPYKTLTSQQNANFIQLYKDALHYRTKMIVFEGETLNIDQIQIEEIKDYIPTDGEIIFYPEEMCIVIKNGKAYKGTYEDKMVFLRKKILQRPNGKKDCNGKKIMEYTTLGAEYVYYDKDRKVIDKNLISFK